MLGRNENSVQAERTRKAVNYLVIVLKLHGISLAHSVDWNIISYCQIIDVMRNGTCPTY